VTDDGMIEQYGKLVAYVASAVARTYSLRDEDREDVASDITLALLRLPDEMREFPGYVRTVINNAARTAIVSLMSHGGSPGAKWRDYATTSFADAAPSRDPYAEEDADAIDRISPTVSPEDALTDRITLDMAMVVLDGREREVVRLYYLEEQTLECVGERLGVTGTTVRNLLRKALKGLRSRMVESA